MKNNLQHPLKQALLSSWSIQSSSKWSMDNPARGQCGVTSLVVNDILGGKILKTKVHGNWHFYNLISGERVDFTASQFTKPIVYKDIKSNREEAFADTNESQYNYLKQNVFKLL